MRREHVGLLLVVGAFLLGWLLLLGLLVAGDLSDYGDFDSVTLILVNSFLVVAVVFIIGVVIVMEEASLPPWQRG
jgi:hypothetical protein